MLVMLFGKKKKEMPARIPTDRVTDLSSQGYSEEDIINTLRTEGYRPREVDAAMREALRGSVRRMPVQSDDQSVYPEESLPRFQERKEPQVSRLPPEFGQERAVPPRPPQRRGIIPPLGREIPQDLPELPELPSPRRPQFPQRPQRMPEPPPVLDEEPMETEDLPPPPEPIEKPRQSAFPPRPRPQPSLPPLDDEFELQRPQPRPIPEPPEFEDLDDEIKPVRGADEKSVENMRFSIEDIQDRLDSIEARIKSIEQKKETASPIGFGGGYKSQESIEDLSERIGSIEGAMKTSLAKITESLRTLTETIRMMRQQQYAARRR